jgi:hypothetical protein
MLEFKTQCIYSSFVGWNKRSGSTIIETFGGCALLHPPYDLFSQHLPPVLNRH